MKKASSVAAAPAAAAAQTSAYQFAPPQHTTVSRSPFAPGLLPDPYTGPNSDQ